MKPCPHCHGRGGFRLDEVDNICPLCEGAGRVAEPRTAWTRHRPAETGFYWVRFQTGAPTPAWWDTANRVLVWCGSSLSIPEADLDAREVEFWPARLEEPDL